MVKGRKCPLPWALTFFGLGKTHSAQMHNQIFDLCYYGNGFIQSDVYQMPTYLRNFYYNKLVEAKKKEKEEYDKANKKIKPPSKVRVRK